MRAFRLFNKTCSEQIGEQIGGEQITVVNPTHNWLLNCPFKILTSGTEYTIINDG